MTTQATTQVKTVLVVDDNPTNLKLTRFLLASEGYRVLTATDGGEAMELLGTVRPDLVLMDIQLPGIDGLEVTRRLKSDPATSGLTIVALSAYAPDSDRAKVTEAGCDGYIGKPINTKTFPGLVRKYLDGGQAAGARGGMKKISTVLVAEDDQVRRTDLRFQLTRAGYTVTTVADGAQALEAAERERPDLVLSDILMPRLDGFRLARAVRTHPDLSDTYVILTTSGAVRETDETLARDNGASALVPKADDAEAILEAIREAPDCGPGTVLRNNADSIESIRRSFLLEGREQLNALLRTDPETWDLEASRQAAHRMAGTGGSLGFPQISQTAFRLEGLLSEDNLDGRALNETVGDLDRLFDQIEQAADRAEAPEIVRAAVRSRKFVLVGFSRAIEYAGGFCRVQETMPLPGDPCDLVIASLRALASSDGTDPGPWPTIVVGPAARLSSIRRTSRIDLLVAPADATEVLLRSFHLLTRPPDQSAGDANAGPGRVLVVDDDPTITALLKSTLVHAGMECHTAGAGREALETARALGPDAIVLDVNLPEIDGFEVLAALKNDSRTRSIPVLMLTARQQEADILRGFALGVADYVVKPFSPMEVAARLGRLLK